MNRARPAALAAALLLAALPAAAADPPADARAQAANYFDAGAQAYASGKYLVAAEAFLEAHELVPSPSLLFSAAQAYRRQYLADPSPETLRRAVALYRDYLRADPKAKRREEAMEALATLAPLEARLSASEPGDAAPAPAPAARPTRVLLSARPDTAEVALDAGPFVAAPLEAEVEPGPHVVRVRAPGYHEEQLTVQAVAHELLPRHVTLRPKPAKLSVHGTTGARIAIDGQGRTTVPTDFPLAVEPGTHFVTVTLSGHRPWGEYVTLRADATTELTVVLEQTPQRLAAWAVLSAGAAGAVASGVLGAFALVRQGEASELRDKQQAGALDEDERDRYNRAAAARDDLAVAAGLVGGAALLTLATGVGLYVLDNPEVLPPAERPDAPAEPAPATDFTVGILSLGFRVSF